MVVRDVYKDLPAMGGEPLARHFGAWEPIPQKAEKLVDELVDQPLND